ncbi:MAG: hypothetical protein STSR0008_02990 [Ignavibacterium sp.]
MASRRNFLKSIGVSAVALGTGFTFGRFIHDSNINQNKINMAAFLPSDLNIITETINAFSKKIKNYSSLNINADNELKNIIKKSFNTENNLLSNFVININIIKYNGNNFCDILLMDNENFIYNPEEDFNLVFNKLRNKIKNQKAEYYLIAEVNQLNIFSSLFNANKKNLIIENDKGIYDKISLNNFYKNIEVNGLIGKTKLQIQNGFISIISSPCKHKICMNSGIISNAGQLIACVPNKVILKIEST